MNIFFAIPGEPVPYMRVTRGRDGKVRVPEKMRKAKTDIGWEVKAQNPGIEPTTHRVSVIASFYTNSERSDLDNLLKLLLDAMNTIVWIDDRQVSKIEAWIQRGVEEPCTTVTVLSLEAP